MINAATSASAPRRVLVAEDDDALREVFVETLTAAGYEVRGVTDGAALLVELARHDRFHYKAVDLVLADLKMPHCSGIQVFDAMVGARAGPRFALITAFPDDSTIAAANRLGAVVIPKPVTMANLIVIVSQILSDARPRFERERVG